MNQKQDRPRQQLQDEAFANSPKFSPQLHARIMRQIQSEEQSAPPPSPIDWQMTRLIRFTSALAAIAAIALSARLYVSRQLPMKPTPPLARVQPSLPRFDLRFPDLSENPDSSLTQARFGYLDRDAKNAAHYVMDQFNVIPTAPARRG